MAQSKFKPDPDWEPGKDAQQMQDEELLNAELKIDVEAIRKRLARASARQAKASPEGSETA